jgi:hypothetical protein
MERTAHVNKVRDADRIFVGEPNKAQEEDLRVPEV